MFVAVTDDGDLVGPADETDGLDLFCPECKEPVISKRGEIMEHHFAHVAGEGNCVASADPWAEKMTRWHRSWQRWFTYEGCATEVPAQGRNAIHRADVITPDGLVIEVQHSPLDVRDIRAREAFWSPMIWLWDAEAIVTGTVQNQAGEKVGRLGWATGRGKWTTTSDPDIDAIPCRAFRWRRPSVSMANATEPLFWDCGDFGIWWMLLSVERMVSEGRSWYSVVGSVMKRMTQTEFIDLVMAGRWSGASGEGRELCGLLRRNGVGAMEAVE